MTPPMSGSSSKMYYPSILNIAKKIAPSHRSQKIEVKINVNPVTEIRLEYYG
jgi:hypothetical protein